MEHTMFYLAVLCYLVATAWSIGYIRRPHKFNIGTVRLVVWVGFGFHTFHLVIRALLDGAFPVANLFATLVFFVWCAVFLYIFIDRVYNVPSILAFLMPVVLLFAMIALATLGKKPALPKDLSTLWLIVHAVPLLAGYGAFTLSFAVSVMYLLQERQLKRKMTGNLFEQLPSLDKLDRINHQLMRVGFPAFTVGVALGFIWWWMSPQLLDGPWYTDAKITLGGATWLIYVAVVHMQFTSAMRGRKIAYMMIAAFCFLLFTFVGTSVFLDAKHAFKEDAAEETSHMEKSLDEPAYRWTKS